MIIKEYKQLMGWNKCFESMWEWNSNNDRFILWNGVTTIINIK